MAIDNSVKYWQPLPLQNSTARNSTFSFLYNFNAYGNGENTETFHVRQVGYVCLFTFETKRFRKLIWCNKYCSILSGMLHRTMFPTPIHTLNHFGFSTKKKHQKEHQKKHRNRNMMRISEAINRPSIGAYLKSPFTQCVRGFLSFLWK